LTDPAAEAARQTETARTRWLDPAWRSTVIAWVAAQLSRHGERITGPVEQPHIRPWSTAMAIPTGSGLAWFKAGGPGNRYEAALLEALSRWQTPNILEPLAVDTERGWLLLPDGGTRLRETLDGGPGIEAWLRILPEWGAIQRGLAPRADELVVLGVPDLRPELLSERLADLVADPGVAWGPGEQARVQGLAPVVETWCTELAIAGIAPTLQHDDLHDGNVFVGDAGDRFFDWGDASVAHPFGTLLVTFRSIASRGLDAPEAPATALARLRDAYLEPWTATHSRAELDHAVPLAMRLAIIGRALSWHRALTEIPPRDHGEWAGNVAGWLLDLLEPELV
jgi:hypothetical protein